MARLVTSLPLHETPGDSFNAPECSQYSHTRKFPGDRDSVAACCIFVALFMRTLTHAPY